MLGFVPSVEVYLDGLKKIKMIDREYYTSNIDAVALLEKYLSEQLGKMPDFLKKPKGKQIFNDNDPYGEELWED